MSHVNHHAAQDQIAVRAPVGIFSFLLLRFFDRFIVAALAARTQKSKDDWRRAKVTQRLKRSGAGSSSYLTLSSASSSASFLSYPAHRAAFWRRSPCMTARCIWSRLRTRAAAAVAAMLTVSSCSRKQKALFQGCYSCRT